MTNERTELIAAVRDRIQSATDETGVLQASIELIDAFSDDYDWTGYYLLREDGKLHVGPYVGPETPHTVIELNRGICGAAASTGKTITVDDVREDERFLACSVTTRSEIVVPLKDGDRVIGEIDIDSNTPHFFTDEDREMLEAIAEIVVARLIEIS
jgi:GAF domain-containing protein